MSIPATPPRPRRALPPRSRVGSAALALLPVACALAALAIGQDANYDLLNYHYYDPYAFLHGRLAVDVIPASLQSYLNPLVDLPFYFLMNHAPPRVEAAVVGAVQGLNLVLVYLIGRRVARSRLVACAATVAAGVAGGFASELGNSMGDTIVSIPLLVGVLCAVVAIERAGSEGGGGRQELAWWVAAGVAAGIGSGLKLSEIPVGLGVVVAAVAVRGRVRDRLVRLAGGALGLAGGVLATSGYWSWFLWRTYKDPIAFSQASFGIFHSPYVPETNLGASRFGPKTLLDAVVFPVYWALHPLRVAEVRLRELSIPIAYLLVAVLVVATLVVAVARVVRGRAGGPSAAGAETEEDASSGRRAEAPFAADVDRYLVALFAVSLALWTKVFDVYRYLIPLELLSPLVAYGAARRILGLGSDASWVRRRGSRALVPGFLCVCALCAATANPANYWGRAPFGSRFFSLALPGVLANGRVDAVVEVGGQPLGFIFPQLPPRIVAIGGIGNLLTPANRALARRALARVRADGGTVDVAFVDVPPLAGLGTPGGTARYLDRLGAPGLVAQVCDVVRAGIGAGYQPVKFCRYGPKGPAV